MKTKTFYVPTDEMVEFAVLIDEWKLKAIIDGTYISNEIVVKVEYDPYKHSQAILELKMNLVNGYSFNEDD